VTSLPASPNDGDECYYLADATNGVVWHLKYRAASASIYKWEYVGGAELSAIVFTPENRTLSAFGDLTTVGPSIVVPLAGDYEFGGVAEIFMSAASAFGQIQLQIGAAVDTNERLVYQSGVASSGSSATSWRNKRRTVTPAATTVKLVYAADGTNATTFSQRRLTARPVRVG
jgi:hypothetical protein